MIVNLFLSNSALERIIKLRLLTEFRPIDEPVIYKGQPCYMDGFEVKDLTLSTPERVVSFALNNLNGTGSEVEPVEPPIGIKPALAILSGDVLMSSVAMVRAAGVVQADERYGLPDRPVDLRVPILGAEFDLFFTVSSKGVPTLNIELRTVPGSELLGDAQAFLKNFQRLTLPFAVGDAFEDFLAPGLTRVLNAGITVLNDGAVIRLEYEPVLPGAANNTRRLNDWLAFFNGQFPSQLNGRDWAFDLPTEEISNKSAREVDEQFNNKDVRKIFTSTEQASGGFFPGWPGVPLLPQGPGFQFKKGGILESVCGGLDVRAEVKATVVLSVAAPNTLRISGSVDIDLNDWDSAKCLGISLINPFAGMITTFDMGAPWWAFVPITILLPLAPLAFGLGGDDFIVREAISKARDKAKKGSPVIVRTSKTTFYVDVEKQITTELTRDWIVIREVRGIGNRLVLSGDFTAPDLNTLPRLRGRLTDPFGFWSKKNRCSTNPQYVSVATITLGLEDDKTGHPVLKPTVPIRYGIDIEKVGDQNVEVGQVTWRIIEDPQGVYRGPKTRVHWTGGASGVFEVEIEHPPQPFASLPYPFRMQFFTSVGVREFEIPAPPPVPKPPATREEQIIEAAERISNCYIFSSLLTRVKALQVHWLPTPLPDTKVGQHWQVLVQGLSPEDRLYAWDVEKREVLAEVQSYNGGLAEVSLVLSPEHPLRSLQLTLNDAPFLEEAVYRRQAASVEGRQEVGPNPVIVRQTPLYLMAQIELDEAAEVLSAHRGTDSLRLLVQGPSGVSQIDLNHLDPGHQPRHTRLEGVEGPRAQLPSRLFKLVRRSREGRAMTEIVGSGIPDEELVLARYYARPWYDRGGVADRFFAQLDDTGTRINVYRRGPTWEAAPELGEVQSSEKSEQEIQHV